MRLSGKNFQCWGDFDLTLDGLTLIVGDSNRGKSAIFRSLKGVLRNELSSEYVRNGQDEKMEVTLEVDGVPPIEASRTRKGTTEYRIGVDEAGKPIEFKALGDSIPEPMEKLKFNKVRIGDTVINPIFSEQNKSQFLIDPDRWKPAELNTILGAFASTERLDAGKKEANLRITQKNGEARTLAEEIREAEERKARLTVLDGQTALYVIEVASAESTVNNAQNRLSSISGATRHLATLAKHRRLVTNLHIPNLSETEKLYNKSRLLSQAAGSHAKVSFLSGCEASLDDVVAKWEPIVKAHKLKRELLSLLAIKERKGLSPRECADRLETLLAAGQLVLSSIAALSSMIETSGRVLTIKDKVKAKEAELANVEEEYTIALHKVSEYTTLKVSEDNKSPKCLKCGGKLVCPTCQS